MNPFDRAWDAITKFDFYMDPSESNQGLHVPPQNIQREEASHFAGFSDSWNPLYANRASEISQQQGNEELYGPKPHPAYQWDPKINQWVPPTTSYRTGASEPRLHDNGSFVGVNLSGLSGDFTDDSKWNENVQNLTSVGAHETVHNLIEPEIDSWAREESGYGQGPQPMEVKDGENSFEALMEQYDRDRKDPKKKNYHTLRSLGHEFGAFSSTPDGIITDDGPTEDESGFMSPDMRTSAMTNRAYKRIAPYVSGDKPFSELRPTQKSEPFDQAWSLLKMPLVQESVKDAGIHPLYENPYYTADFEFPEGHERYGEKLPMEFHQYRDGGGSVYVKDEGVGDVGTMSLNRRETGGRDMKMQEILDARNPEPEWDAGDEAWNEHKKKEHEIRGEFARNPKPSTNVESSYQRAGMGSAMNDLATIAGTPVYPDIQQTTGAKAMWEKNQGQPLPPITDPSYSSITWRTNQ